MLSLVKAAPLKSEIRLGLAISDFEANLHPVHKAEFRAEKTRFTSTKPSAQDVLRLTAQIDQRAAGKCHGSRCFGPRFNNVLHAIQRFASIGDIVVGGSQNPIACGVWAVVRTGILALSSSVSAMESLSSLFMTTGRNLPRYEKLSSLYPLSKDLQKQVCEYLIIVVKLCGSLIKISRKSAFEQLISPFSESDLRGFQLDLDLWAGAIRDELQALTAQNVQSTGGLIQTIGVLTTDARRLNERHAALAACSTYDHETSWKQKRKAGRANLYKTHPSYEKWLTASETSTLVIKGKLGSGKSVLLADIVAELNATAAPNDMVAFFFCRYDDHTSLNARSVIGSLTKQLLEILPASEDLAKALQDASSLPQMDIDDLMRLIKKTVPEHKTIYLVIDGIGEMPVDEALQVLQTLTEMTKLMKLKPCLSTRYEAKSRIIDAISDHLEIVIPEKDNADMERFIKEELETRVFNGSLTVRDPLLILEIRNVLTNGAQGMFLWVVLQIETLCRQNTDASLRQALKTLPETLAETYARILQNCKANTGDQSTILRIVGGAMRPLNEEEFREAASVRPGESELDESYLINDVREALESCGSLIIVDEEDTTISFTHHSVLHYLLSDYGDVDGQLLTRFKLHRTMADIVITYLTYEMVGKEVAKTNQSVPDSIQPADILRHALPPGLARDIALNLLGQKKAGDLDISKAILGFINRSSYHENPRHLLDYAKKYLWQQSWTYLAGGKANMRRLLLKLCPVNHNSTKHPKSWASVDGLQYLMHEVTWNLSDSDKSNLIDVLCIRDQAGEQAMTWLVRQRQIDFIDILSQSNSYCSTLQQKDCLQEGLYTALTLDRYHIAAAILEAGYPINHQSLTKRSRLSIIQRLRRERRLDFHKAIKWLSDHGAQDDDGFTMPVTKDAACDLNDLDELDE